MSKISLRFYKDRQVRAIWDDEHSKWWFSAIDIIRAINEDPPSTLRYLYNRNQFPTKSSKSGSTIHDLH